MEENRNSIEENESQIMNDSNNESSSKIKLIFNYIKDHPIKSILIASGVAACSYGTYKLGAKYNYILTENEHLKNKIQTFEFNNNKKNDDLVNMTNAYCEAMDRVIELEAICKEKDDCFKKLISDDMRNGGSFGGRQMAYLKHDSTKNNLYS